MYNIKNKLSCDKKEFIANVCQQFFNDKGELINILHALQSHFGYLPPEVQLEVARQLNIPVSEVYGVVTFYSLFTMEPKGKFPISICTGTACYVRGANDIVTECEKILGIKVGQTTDDGKYSLSTLRCVGACGLAPVMMIGDKIHGHITVEQVGDLLRDH